MSDVEELVLQLWREASNETRLSFEKHPVDAVRSLEAEVERLRAFIKTVRPTMGERKRTIEYWREKARVAEAENERLRAERDELREVLFVVRQALEGKAS
jgi:hypothetical protein